MRNILLFATALAAIGAASCSSSSDTPDNQWVLVENHYYIDHLPKNERDMIKQLVFVDNDGQHVGARAHASRFRVFIDWFTWERSRDRVSTTILQTNKKLGASFKAWSCKGKAPAPFELCLELKEGDHVMRLFSRNDWIVEGGGKNVADQIATLRAQLPVDENAAAADDHGDDVIFDAAE